MKWRFLLLGLLAAVQCVPAGAQTANAMKQQMEAQMLVAGTVDIETDGRVSAVSLDDLAQIPGAVVDLIERAAAKWRFEAILMEGTPVPARARMSLKVVATKVPGNRDEFALRLDGARFGEEEPDHAIASDVMKPPEYPRGALHDGVSGTAYLAVRVGSDGRVVDAVIEQVNLEQAGEKRRMDNWRKDFAEAALKAARDWRFQVSADAPDDPRLWTVRVPVDYKIQGARKRKDAWWVYIPGPRSGIPWLDGEQSAVPPDALAADGVHPVTDGHRLLTALDPGT
jgi:TonB family protein